MALLYIILSILYLFLFLPYITSKTWFKTLNVGLQIIILFGVLFLIWFITGTFPS